MHYGGHGVEINGLVSALCDYHPGTKETYAIEYMLRRLSTKPGAYVIGLLDCCRSHMDMNEIRARNDI